MHHFLDVATIISTLKTGQRSGSRCPGTAVPGHPQTQPWLNTYGSARIFIFLRASSIFYAHLRFSMRIFSILRASSIFYAHLQHDQDFPSDTRPRDAPASRLAPGHALVTLPFGANCGHTCSRAITKLPVITPASTIGSSSFLCQ